MKWMFLKIQYSLGFFNMLINTSNEEYKTFNNLGDTKKIFWVINVLLFLNSKTFKVTLVVNDNLIVVVWCWTNYLTLLSFLIWKME